MRDAIFTCLPGTARVFRGMGRVLSVSVRMGVHVFTGYGTGRVLPVRDVCCPTRDGCPVRDGNCLVRCRCCPVLDGVTRYGAGVILHGTGRVHTRYGTGFIRYWTGWVFTWYGVGVLHYEQSGCTALDGSIRTVFILISIPFFF